MNLSFKNFTRLYMVLIQYFLSYIFIITFNIYKPDYIIFLSLGIFVFNFIGAYLLENIDFKKKKIFLMSNYLLNLILSCIYFFYYKNFIHLSTFQIKVLWFLIGTTLTLGTNHFLQFLTINYKSKIKEIFNITSIFLWGVVAFFIHFKSLVIKDSNMYFLIYIFFMYKLLYLLYEYKDEGELEKIFLSKSSSIKEFTKEFFLKIEDKDLIICCVFFIFILHIQFYSLVAINVNVLYLLLGGVISSLLFNLVTINNLKFFLLLTIVKAIAMFHVPFIYQSIISGMLASSIFLIYKYIYTYYEYNICKIYSILNIFNFISKNSLFLYYFKLKDIIDLNLTYSFLLVGFFTYILLKFQVDNKTYIKENL
jgi:hypothetical protein